MAICICFRLSLLSLPVYALAVFVLVFVVFCYTNKMLEETHCSHKTDHIELKIDQWDNFQLHVLCTRNWMVFSVRFHRLCEQYCFVWRNSFVLVWYNMHTNYTIDIGVFVYFAIVSLQLLSLSLAILAVVKKVENPLCYGYWLIIKANANMRFMMDVHINIYRNVQRNRLSNQIRRGTNCSQKWSEKQKTEKNMLQ